MAISEEEIEQVGTFLNSKMGGNCVSCGKNAGNGVEKVGLPVAGDNNTINLGRNLVMYAVTCSNCGSTRLFSVGKVQNG